MFWPLELDEDVDTSGFDACEPMLGGSICIRAVRGREQRPRRRRDV